MIFDIVLMIAACCMLIFSPAGNTTDTQYVNEQNVVSENAGKQSAEASEETGIINTAPGTP